MKRSVLLLALLTFNTQAAWETREQDTRQGKSSLLTALGKYSLIQIQCYQRLPGQFRLDIGTNLTLGPIPARNHNAIVDFRIDGHPLLRFDNVAIMMGENRKTTYITMSNQARYLDRLIQNMKMSKTLKFDIYYNGNVVTDEVDMGLFMKHYLNAYCFSGMKNNEAFDDRR